MWVGTCVSTCLHGAGISLLAPDYKVLASIPCQLMQDLCGQIVTGTDFAPSSSVSSVCIIPPILHIHLFVIYAI